MLRVSTFWILNPPKNIFIVGAQHAVPLQMHKCAGKRFFTFAKFQQNFWVFSQTHQGGDELRPYALSVIIYKCRGRL